MVTVPSSVNTTLFTLERLGSVVSGGRVRVSQQMVKSRQMYIRVNRLLLISLDKEVQVVFSITTITIVIPSLTLFSPNSLLFSRKTQVEPLMVLCIILSKTAFIFIFLHYKLGVGKPRLFKFGVAIRRNPVYSHLFGQYGPVYSHLFGQYGPVYSHLFWAIRVWVFLLGDQLWNNCQPLVNIASWWQKPIRLKASKERAVNSSAAWRQLISPLLESQEYNCTQPQYTVQLYCCNLGSLARNWSVASRQLSC